MNTQNPTRQLLLEQGLRLCREKGLRGIKVRELAASAGVNLGSFVYHFGNRERFLDELVELWYAPMFAAISRTTQAQEHQSAFARLQAVLEQIVTLAADNAALTDFCAHLAQAIAGAVVDHIKSSAVVTPTLLVAPSGGGAVTGTGKVT